MDFKRICVVGLGYIGLPTAAVFASRKHYVIGVDVNEKAVETINQGKIHIIEPDLDMVVSAAVTQGYLRATTTLPQADAFLIAVPTPFKENHEPDLGYIEASARSIAPQLEAGNLIVLESTSPVGATEQMAAWLAEERPDLSFPQQKGEQADINIAHCPERVLPGHVLRELVENDRVIGGMTDKCAVRATALYKSFVKGKCIKTNARTAEMAKLTENAFRDVNIAFANELSLIADKLDIDVWELISLSNRHPRVNILQPGPGVGGHCIAVDPWFIVAKTPEQAPLIRTAREVNDGKPGWVIDKVHETVKKLQKKKKGHKPVIGCFGIAFKADIDDLRESPALQIVENLASKGFGELLVVEPNIEELPEKLAAYDDVSLTELDEALQRVDIVLLLVDHREFIENLPGSDYSGEVIDTRGVWK